MILNQDRILTAIMESTDNGMAREAAAPLVEGWIERFYEADSEVKTVAVELGLQVWLDKNTVVVGVMDRIAQDSIGYFGSEWKTHKEPRMTKAGVPYKGEGEEDWLKEISNGSQLATYAMALHQGKFYQKDGGLFEFKVENPRILVRAAIKSNPPIFWPETEPGVFQFPNEMFTSVANAYLNRAAAIRSMRGTGALPWQMPGKQCFSWGRECQFLGACSTRQHVLTGGALFDPNDPAAQLAVAHLSDEEKANPELVVLSSSSYQASGECAEKYRLVSLAGGQNDQSLALDTGTAAHAGWAEYYRQWRDSVAA